MARMQGSVNLAKNLTIKSLPNLDLTISEGDAPRALCTFLGTVTGTEIKTTAIGESVRFIGQFEAIDLETGEAARGSSLYLPGHAETVVADAFTSANGRPIQFAINVGLKYRKVGNKDGCEYTVSEVGGITEHDPLASLKAQFGIVARAPALAAPVEPPALAAPVEAPAPAAPVEAPAPAATAQQAEPGEAAEAASASDDRDGMARLTVEATAEADKATKSKGVKKGR